MPDQSVVLVGAGDIAVASALALRSQGYGKVYVLSRGVSETGSRAIGTLESAGYTVTSLKCDVSDWESLNRAATLVAEPVGALVYSPAGDRVFQALEDLTQEEWDKSFDLFAGGLIGSVKALLPKLVDGTSIVVLSGTSAHTVVSSRHLAMGSAKAAAERAVGYLSDALADKRVRVNGVACGPVETSSTRKTMTELEFEQLREWQSSMTIPGRLAQPEDVGRIVGLLCAPDFEWLAGQVIVADGGALNRSGSGGSSTNVLDDLLGGAGNPRS